MLLAIIKKEFLLVGRDIHALAVLFLMPMVFIFIMSLSLQDTFQDDSGKLIKIGFIFNSPNDESSIISKKLLNQTELQTVVYTSNIDIKKAVTDDELSAMIVLPKGFIHKLENNIATDDSESQLQLTYAPTTPQYLRKLIYASINQKFFELQMEKILGGKTLNTGQDAKHNSLPNSLENNLLKDKLTKSRFINEKELYKKQIKIPSSVEQTVPAWLIFSMFFVVIPLSTTFILEKQYGTFQRLRTMPVPGSYILIGKLVPYLLINLIQTLLMFVVGIYVLPLVGGQGITLGNNAWLLLPMTFSVSVLAISFALFVATLVKTTEQASATGGLSNIIFAAIGGIMVPTFVMPEMMQSFARLSPMNWGLEGFLEIILREGSFTSITPFIIKLLFFAIVFFSIALINYQRINNQK